MVCLEWGPDGPFDQASFDKLLEVGDLLQRVIADQLEMDNKLEEVYGWCVKVLQGVKAKNSLVAGKYTVFMLDVLIYWMGSVGDMELRWEPMRCLEELMDMLQELKRSNRHLKGRIFRLFH